jgi:hypothetical protein
MPPLLNKTTDQRIVHHGTWEQFKFIQKGFNGSPGVRLFYYEGAIEILMPGQDHETFARVIGYLVTTFLVEQGIFFKPTGAMTQKNQELSRSSRRVILHRERKADSRFVDRSRLHQW